jgi:ribosomal protein S6
MSKEQNTEINESANVEGIRVYELAFHLIPTLSDEEITVQFSHLKSLIEKKGGTFIGEGAPAMIDLAYEISKTVKALKKRYNKAYFGWVKFEINPEEIAAIEKDMKAFETVIRYLVITTVRENTYIGPKELSKDATKDGVKDPSKKPATKDADVVVTDAVPATDAVASEAQVDKPVEQTA